MTQQKLNTMEAATFLGIKPNKVGKIPQFSAITTARTALTSGNSIAISLLVLYFMILRKDKIKTNLILGSR